VLHYESHTATADGFEVVVKDLEREIFVTLHYAIDPESGILARSATIENREGEAVTLEQAAAAAWALPPAHYTLSYLTGRWAGEWTLTQETLRPGARVLESRRGSTGHQANRRTTSLTYRMLSSMQGSLGIGANITKWTAKETALARRLIAAHHEVQTTIVQGELYRLISPRNGSAFSATQTVNDDQSQSVVFVFIHSTQEGRGFPRLKLKGLDPGADYTLTPIRGEGAHRDASSGQRRLVDESWAGDGRGLQGGLPGGSLPAGPQEPMTA